MRSASPALPSSRDRHRVVRQLGSLAAALLVVNAVFWFWPDPDLTPGRPLVMATPEAVALDLIEPTTQVTPDYIPPPPPPPAVELPPEEVPDEVIVRDVAPELPRVVLDPVTTTTPRPSAPALPAPPGPPAPPSPPGEAPRAAMSERIVEQPTRSPRQRRVPLPSYPDAARREGVRARVRVRVLVSETGRVLSAEVTDRFLVDRRDDETPVASLPYDMDAAALDAARRSSFQAARDGDERVRAYAVITLVFDPPRGG